MLRIFLTISFFVVFQGAESFSTYKGYLYSGVQGGDIVRLPLSDPIQGPWEFYTKIGIDCEGLHEEEKCGRVLGIEIDQKGNFFCTKSGMMPYFPWLGIF